MSDDREWAHKISDMLDCIGKIQSYIADSTYDDFKGNQMMMDAVERNIEIVGEAANKVPETIQKEHSNIPWRDIIGMRHRLVHDYGRTNPEILWNVAFDDLPGLEKDLRSMQDGLKGK